MLAREIGWDEVVEAGTVIFGPSFEAVARSGAWRGDLHATFRRRVLETHPDRAAVLGRTEAELAREFHALSEAYELLARLRAGPLPAAPAPPRPATSEPARAAAPRQPRPAGPAPSGAATRAWGPRRAAQRPSEVPRSPAAQAGQAAGAVPRAEPSPRAARAGRERAVRAGTRLPRRRLRLAEFLYYSGRVGWRDLAGALAWQRAQRPPVGQVAVEFGFLTREEVAGLLERRRRDGAAREPFGEYALRRGRLTSFQLRALLGQQLRLQRPIGRYFVERGLVGDAALDEARGAVLRHNAGFPAVARRTIRPA